VGETDWGLGLPFAVKASSRENAPDFAYRRRLPSPVLATHVALYWEYETLAREGSVMFLPTGCCDLIHTFDRPFESAESSLILSAGQCYAVGAFERPGQFHACLGSRVFAIRFHPGCFDLAVRAPASDMARKAVALDDLGAAALRWRDFGDRLTAAPDFDARVRLAEHVLRAQLNVDRQRDEAVCHALRLLSGEESHSVSSAARASGLGERQFERRFRSATGLSPIVFRRLERFHRARGLIETTRTAPSEVAMIAGYYDQAHFTKEFHLLSGRTPLEHRASGHDGFLQYSPLSVR
jgi:AraC-like DNA-binding protein